MSDATLTRDAASPGTSASTSAAPRRHNPTRSKAREEFRQRLRPVWEAYRATGEVALRNQIVEAYHYLVKIMANRIAARLPRTIDVGDLRSAGNIGLIRAVEQFDIHNGTPFESYGALRIRGAILDSLRKQDWVPRLVRKRAATWRRTTEALRLELDREPMDDEVAERLGIKRADSVGCRRQSQILTVFTLSPKDDGDDDPRTMHSLDAMLDRRSDMPVERFVTADLARTIVRSLTKPEQTVIALYYEEGLTMREIGGVMGISESRICQIHSKCLKSLRELLTAQGYGHEIAPEQPAMRWSRV